MDLIDFQGQLQQQQSDERFKTIVAPLEAKMGRSLMEPGRSACRAAFSENADGFARVAADALQRGRNPLALLCRLVKDGDHRVAEAPAGTLERALAWADNAGRLLERDHREEILAGFGLDEHETAQVRLRLLGPVELEAYGRTCALCRSHPCVCEHLEAA